MRLIPPLIMARTVWRFGSNRRGLTLFAWLCCRPTTGVFPQTAHFFAMVFLLRNGLEAVPYGRLMRGTVFRPCRDRQTNP